MEAISKTDIERNRYYQSVSSAEIIDLPAIVQETSFKPNNTHRVLYVLIFTVSFLFYGYCVFRALAPAELFFPQSEEIEGVRHRYLTTKSTCTMADAAMLTGVGACAGLAIAVGSMAMLGLGATGPVAGGVFAGLQAGGWVSAGSTLAAVQSAAMTGAAAGSAAAIGAVSGAAASCL